MPLSSGVSCCWTGDDAGGVPYATFLRFAGCSDDCCETNCRPSSALVTSINGLSGLDDGVMRAVGLLFNAGPARSRSALRAALGAETTRGRGVKKRLNFLGVIDGFLRSFARVRGGDRKAPLAASPGRATGLDDPGCCSSISPALPIRCHRVASYLPTPSQSGLVGCQTADQLPTSSPFGLIRRQTAS